MNINLNNSVIHKQNELPVPRVRKRARQLKSCLVCRQKKTKCDAIRPVCGSCKVRGRPDLCHYQDAEWNHKTSDGGSLGGLQTYEQRLQPQQPSQQEQPQQQPIQPNQQLLQLPQQQKEEYRTISRNSSSSENNNSLNAELLAINTRMAQLESLLAQNQHSNQTSPTSAGHESDKRTKISPKITNGLLTENEEVIDFHIDNLPEKFPMSTHGVLSWISIIRKDIYLSSITNQVKNQKILVNKVREQKSGQIKEFVEKFQIEEDIDNLVASTQSIDQTLQYLLSTALSDSKLVWLLVDKFFDSEIYFILPILDRNDFTSQLIGILGPKDISLTDVKIENRIDLAVVSTLVLVMRLASFAVYNCNKQTVEQLSDDDQYIMDHPVNKIALTLVERCSRELENYRDSQIQIFQFFLMKASYAFFSPEDATCSTFADPSILGKLLDHAFRCGLNRDPSFSKDKSASANLIRRLWYKVLFLDQHQLMLIGCPSLIDVKYYDTQPPRIGENDNETDDFVDEIFANEVEKFNQCYPLLMLILDVRSVPRVSEVQKHLVILKKIVSQGKTISEIRSSRSFNVRDRARKLSDLMSWLDFSSLLFVINYHFFLYYSKKGNAAESLHYLIELLKLCKEMYPLLFYLDPAKPEYNMKEDFGPAMLLIPRVELVLHRTVLLMVAITSRLRSLISLSTSLKPEISEVVEQICKATNKVIYSIINGYVAISDVYYHSWLVSKVEIYIAENFTDVKDGKKPECFMEFIKKLSVLKHSDSVIFDYSRSDLQLVLDALLEFDDVELDISPNNTNLNDIDFINETDRLWLNKMMQYEKRHNDTPLDFDHANIIPDKYFNEAFGMGDYLLGYNHEPFF
ncbi:hypothetical protein WICMUC_002873 [Wickerhamomyces mucosus]|uniref:Zn(2)-C6 fungal-type domain-containing protein n=1 Tax=Wickerhamomyces mucosus TaxID=1378264 RepID=A0A9P8PN19_9ASCO|nr:hypothetical protein WICMUC_002873 [Wickerhamomyces mucosus]